mmetsp:Transcript_14086/g.38758  ORF Transcript_14086/g.38758 Transcript_14086/m.38758 type:complete len:232 (-) Transcript_14086:807-1502(-)
MVAIVGSILHWWRPIRLSWNKAALTPSFWMIPVRRQQRNSSSSSHNRSHNRSHSHRHIRRYHRRQRQFQHCQETSTQALHHSNLKFSPHRRQQREKAGCWHFGTAQRRRRRHHHRHHLADKPAPVNASRKVRPGIGVKRFALSECIQLRFGMLPPVHWQVVSSATALVPSTPRSRGFPSRIAPVRCSWRHWDACCVATGSRCGTWGWRWITKLAWDLSSCRARTLSNMSTM